MNPEFNNQDIKSHRWAARLFGIFFILAFLSYGVGSGLVDTIAGSEEGLAGIAANKTTLMIGVMLMAIVHSVVNIGLSVLAFPALQTVSGYAARGYLAAGITATVTAVTGALFLALLVPLSDAFVAGGNGGEHFDAIALVLRQGGFFGYQLSMTLWGIGGLILCTTLFVSRLVPRVLSVWGLIGYVVFMIGTTAEMFGYGIGVMLALPGGLFELSLSVWLIIKGFNLPTAERATA
ncbi:DUF4386 domain-containing protein [Cucumibacter marinus]|uniref:DUF4386 domain-containing protein n=1 Tax=Cucumibacter marinus TaxID=1121252 RepID=UPI0004916E84|nr:DUF4386 domain-containing protein [Cucumibacter marinus]